MKWSKFTELIKEHGFELRRSFGVGYIIVYNKERLVTITDTSLMQHGSKYKSYTHDTECSYHKDNWVAVHDDYVGPPQCDCPYEEEVTDIEPMLNSTLAFVLRKKQEMMKS